jgi:hypothetical protein
MPEIIVYAVEGRTPEQKRGRAKSSKDKGGIPFSER